MNTENNKKIAEFLGWKEQTDPTERWFGNFINPLTREYHKELYFDIDWNWLMEVVERIEGLGFYYQIHPNRCFFTREEFGEDEGLKNNVYNAVIAFIDLYNENGAKEN